MPAFAATIDVQIRESPHGYMTMIVLIVGEIELGDTNDVESAIAGLPDDARHEVEEVRFILASSGGHLYEAMKLGRYARSLGAVVVVPAPAFCDSACVFVLAGGIHRFPDGAIRIHRPFYPSEPHVSPGEGLRQTLQDVRDYFGEMNIPSGLADAMFSTPPEQMRRLDGNELQQYRLNQTDFVYQEERDLEMARNLGMSRTEYLAIRRDLHDRCGRYTRHPQELQACVSEIYDEVMSR